MVTAYVGSSALVRLTGRLDGEWSRHLADTLDELLRDGLRSVVLEMSQVDYVSSPGIAGPGPALSRLQRPPGRASRLLTLAGGPAGPDRRRTPRTAAAPAGRRARRRRRGPSLGALMRARRASSPATPGRCPPSPGRPASTRSRGATRPASSRAAWSAAPAGFARGLRDADCRTIALPLGRSGSASAPSERRSKRPAPRSGS